jgi:guanine deaminase
MCLFRVMKDMAFMQSQLWFSPAELFYRATLAGAQAIGLDQSTGSLEKGKDADFIVVDPRKRTSIVSDILEQAPEEILSSLAYLGDDRLIMGTFVRGKLVYQSALPDLPLPRAEAVTTRAKNI